MRYRVKLDIFEGPFDLLLFLIRKEEVDIYDIPIARIIEQFLAYMEALELLDLNVAGDFIEMVAILMHIKARMLLPRTEIEGEEVDDPRTELVERLIEYKRYKEAAFELDDLEEKRSKLYSRKYFNFLPGQDEITDEEYLDQINLFDLMLAFRKALDNMPKVVYHEVKKIDVTIEQQSAYIVDKLKSKKVVLFQDLMREIKEKIVLIVTFIAILELVRNHQIEVRQSKVFDDIRIKSKEAA